MQCAACGATNDDHARFCSECGKRVQAASPANLAPPVNPAPPANLAPPAMPAGLQPSGLRICGACGANVPPALAACGACNGAVSTVLTIPQPAHGVVFVQVRLKLGCVQCGNRSPIDMLDADGRYFCFSCQQDRQFDTDLWHERIVPMAAIVADGFWTNMRMLPPWPPVMPEEDWLEDQEGWSEIGEVIPQLMKDFLPRIGIERARLTMEQEGTVFGAGGMKTSTHEVALFPGYPLCTICKSPVQVGFPKRGVAQVGCLRCNVHETHVSSEELVAKCPDLIAAIAPDHVQGRPPVRTEAKAGTAALAVLCPQCGASLAMPTGTRTVTCTHCRATAIVPERLAATPGQTPDPEGWWLALYAPCSLRKLLSQPGAGRNKDDDDD